MSVNIPYMDSMGFIIEEVLLWTSCKHGCKIIIYTLFLRCFWEDPTQIMRPKKIYEVSSEKPNPISIARRYNPVAGRQCSLHGFLFDSTPPTVSLAGRATNYPNPHDDLLACLYQAFFWLSLYQVVYLQLLHNKDLIKSCVNPMKYS